MATVLFFIFLFVVIGFVINLFVAALQSSAIDEYKKDGLIKESEITDEKVKQMWGLTPITSAIIGKMIKKNKQESTPQN